MGIVAKDSYIAPRVTHAKDSHENIIIGSDAITRGVIVTRVTNATTGLPEEKYK